MDEKIECKLCRRYMSNMNGTFSYHIMAYLGLNNSDILCDGCARDIKNETDKHIEEKAYHGAIKDDKDLDKLNDVVLRYIGSIDDSNIELSDMIHGHFYTAQNYIDDGIDYFNDLVAKKFRDIKPETRAILKSMRKTLKLIKVLKEKIEFKRQKAFEKYHLENIDIISLSSLTVLHKALNKQVLYKKNESILVADAVILSKEEKVEMVLNRVRRRV